MIEEERPAVDQDRREDDPAPGRRSQAPERQGDDRQRDRPPQQAGQSQRPRDEEEDGGWRVQGIAVLDPVGAGELPRPVEPVAVQPALGPLHVDAQVVADRGLAIPDGGDPDRHDLECDDDQQRGRERAQAERDQPPPHGRRGSGPSQLFRSFRTHAATLAGHGTASRALTRQRRAVSPERAPGAGRVRRDGPSDRGAGGAGSTRAAAGRR